MMVSKAMPRTPIVSTTGRRKTAMPWTRKIVFFMLPSLVLLVLNNDMLYDSSVSSSSFSLMKQEKKKKKKVGIGSFDIIGVSGFVLSNYYHYKNLPSSSSSSPSSILKISAKSTTTMKRKYSSMVLESSFYKNSKDHNDTNNKNKNKKNDDDNVLHQRLSSLRKHNSKMYMNKNAKNNGIFVATVAKSRTTPLTPITTISPIVTTTTTTTATTIGSNKGLEPVKVLLLLLTVVAAGIGIATTVPNTNGDWNNIVLDTVGTSSTGSITTISSIQQFLSTVVVHPQTILDTVVTTVESMGPIKGPLYYCLFYIVAELLAIPATPLTLSAGYLFGMTYGTIIVVSAATIAASISFYIGKTFLRSYIVTNILPKNPKFIKIDNALGKNSSHGTNNGFQLLLLIRLSPIFPFALSNYMYGASSIEFVPYFWGTLLGFVPGTIAYIYTGMVGKEILVDQQQQQQHPWYMYALGFTVLITILKLLTDVATNIVNTVTSDE